MKRIRFIAPVVGALAIATYAAFAADTASAARPPRMGPPPEAMAACNGKAAGDKVSVTMADGRSIAGSCLLMFRPDQPLGQ